MQTSQSPLKREPDAAGTITIAEIEFLLDSGRASTVVLGGHRLVSVDDLRRLAVRPAETSSTPTLHETGVVGQ